MGVRLLKCQCLGAVDEIIRMAVLRLGGGDYLGHTFKA